MNVNKTQTITMLACVGALILLVYITYYMDNHVCTVEVEMNGNADANVILNELNVSLGNTTQLDGEFGGGMRIYFNGPCYMITRAIEEK